MIFCNISSDKVHIADTNEEIFLERNGIEKVLGPILVDWTKKSPFDQVFLLNGPGGFTNLRVWAVTWNLVAHLINLHNQNIQFFSCTKIDFYRYFVQKWVLPHIGYIYLWQKNVVWKYDFENNLYEIVNQPFVFSKDSFCDFVQDSVYWWNVSTMVRLGCDVQWCFLLWNNQKYYFVPEDFGLLPKFAVSPEYFIDPTV